MKPCDVGQLNAIYFRHMQVGNQGCDYMSPLFQVADRVSGIIEKRHNCTIALQHFRQKCSGVRLIVDNQNMMS